MSPKTMREGSLSARMAALVVAGVVSVAAGWGKKAAPPAPPPPEVSVLTVRQETIPAVYDWVAQAAASKSVQVRAQVSGVIVERPYVEGTDVRKGKVLYRIDPRALGGGWPVQEGGKR